MIGFNKPYITGKEFEYIQEAIRLQKLSGNGYFTKRCHKFFEQRYGFRKCLLTHSATAALEMAALLIDIQPGDEVIVPSYTFVSTANAFVLRGAKIVFADSNDKNPNVDVNHAISLITPKTKAIVVVHYAGIACDMDVLMDVARAKNIFVIEDAAQAIDSYYKGRPLGSIGHLAAFSFHETKNIISGEGGMLVVNDNEFAERSEIIWEKGTNRAAFSRREVGKYEWVDIGSSYLPSEITAAFLYAQLEKIDDIQTRRKKLWDDYYEALSIKALKSLRLPARLDHVVGNHHIFYILVSDFETRNNLLQHLTDRGIQAIFHYLPLHNSPFFRTRNMDVPALKNAEFYGNTLIRLPLYLELTMTQIDLIATEICNFFSPRES